jgi:uncharacterized protein HemY
MNGLTSSLWRLILSVVIVWAVVYAVLACLARV